MHLYVHVRTYWPLSKYWGIKIMWCHGANLPIMFILYVSLSGSRHERKTFKKKKISLNKTATKECNVV